MRLLIVFSPVNVNIHIFYRNINIFDYGMLAQTLMGAKQLLKPMTCLKRLDKSVIVNRVVE